MSGRIGEASLRAALLLGVSLIALPAAAQEPSLEPAQEIVLDTIVITASRTEQTMMDLTRSVATVEKEEIEVQSANDVAEFLKDIPGVDVVEGSTAGLRRISIRGEGQSRNTILIDGQEISDHSSYGALFMIDPAMVERIEVVKGPSSVLHGSKAIGGVVNIITKKGADKALQVSIGGGYDSSTRGYNSNASAAGSKGNWDYRVTLSKSDHGDRDTPDGRQKATALNNGSSFSNEGVSASFGYTNGNHSLRLALEKMNMDSESYVDPSTLGIPLQKFILDLPQRDRSKIGFFYDGTDISERIRKVHFDAYAQQIERVIDIDFEMSPPLAPVIKSVNHTEDDQMALGANAQIDLSLLDNHLTIFGAQIVKDSIDRIEQRNGSIKLPGPRPPMPVTSDWSKEASITTISAFVQDEWDVSDTFNITGGLRYFYIDSELSKTNQTGHSPFSKRDDALIGSIGVNYTGIQDVALRANIAQGYVYPTLLQNMLGSSFSPAGVIEANKDLVAENSINYEVGARYDNGVAMLDLAAFYSVADDYIDNVDCGSFGTVCASGSRKKYVNIDAAKTYGLEIAGSYENAAWGLTPYFSATFMKREFENAGTKTSNTDTPSLAGRIGVRKNWDLHEGLMAYTDLYVRGATARKDGSTKHNSFATLNLASSLTYDFGNKSSLRLNASVENIFDQSYVEPKASVTAPGRTFKISSQLTF